MTKLNELQMEAMQQLREVANGMSEEGYKVEVVKDTEEYIHVLTEQGKIFFHINLFLGHPNYDLEDKPYAGVFEPHNSDAKYLGDCLEDFKNMIRGTYDRREV